MSSPSEVSRQLDRHERLDRLPFTRAHARLLTGSGIGWALDAMDVGLISFVMVALKTQWRLDNTQLSWIASIGFVGMALGATLGGLLADRRGRRQVFAATLLVYGLATGASALVGSLAALMALRFVVGLGLGAELPVASTLVSEFAPRRIRGRVVVALEAFWAVGWIAAAVIGYFVVPVSDDGWRWALAVGTIPTLYAVVVRFGLPESVRFLERQGREVEAERVVARFEQSAVLGAEIARRSREIDALGPSRETPAHVVDAGEAAAPEVAGGGTDGGEAAGPAPAEARAATTPDEAASVETPSVETPPVEKRPIETPSADPSAPAVMTRSKALATRSARLWSPAYRVRTAALWTVWFMVNWSYYGAFIWLPTYLAGQGFGMVKSFEFTLYITLAQLPGYALAAYLIERWGRRSTLATFLVGSSVAAWAFGHSHSAGALIAAGMALSFFNLGAWGALYAATPEAYPTAMRASGAGAAAGFGRIASILAPLVTPLLLVGGGPSVTFGVFGVAFGIAAAAAFFLPEMTDQALE